MPAETRQAGELALRDIHLPEPISWWPPAPGWWIIAIVGIAVVIAVFLLRKRKLRTRLQRTALAELETIRKRYRHDQDTRALIRSLSVLLRRACMSFYPRANTASLTGEAWLGYLERTAPGNGFTSETGRLLVSAPYLPDNSLPTIDADALTDMCENWLRAQSAKHDNEATLS